MSNETNSQKIYCLMFPGVLEEVVARGTKCATREAAEMLLSDRVANGDSFSNEYVALVRTADYADATGDRSVLRS